MCPSWRDIPDLSAVNVLLDPGLAFGTGTHPTTALCLEWLDSQDLTDKTVVDFGCGSGILAIAALKLGAKNDPTKWDDYLFHIANFANPNRNLGTLPALKDVWNTINLSNIQRLKSTGDALQVAITVFKTIENSIRYKEQ